MNFKQLEFDPDSSKECDFCLRNEFSLILENPSQGQMLEMSEDEDGYIWCEGCKENYAAVIAEHPVVEHCVGANQLPNQTPQ
jgi:hypothetical protein